MPPNRRFEPPEFDRTPLRFHVSPVSTNRFVPLSQLSQRLGANPRVFRDYRVKKHAIQIDTKPPEFRRLNAMKLPFGGRSADKRPDPVPRGSRFPLALGEFPAGERGLGGLQMFLRLKNPRDSHVQLADAPEGRQSRGLSLCLAEPRFERAFLEKTVCEFDSTL